MAAVLKRLEAEKSQLRGSGMIIRNGGLEQSTGRWREKLIERKLRECSVTECRMETEAKWPLVICSRQQGG